MTSGPLDGNEMNANKHDVESEGAKPTCKKRFALLTVSFAEA